MNKPEQINVAGERYKLTVFLVTSAGARGRPMGLEVVHDDETVDVGPGTRFFSAYMHEAVPLIYAGWDAATS